MYLILLSIVVPIVFGVGLLLWRDRKPTIPGRRRLLQIVGTAYLLTGALVISALLMSRNTSYTLFYLTRALPICFCIIS